MERVVESHPPCAMHSLAVFPNLIGGKAFSTMRADRQNIRGTVGNVNACSGQRYDHDRPRKVAGRMSHRLVSCRNPEGGSVIVHAEMHARAAAFRSFDKAEQRTASLTFDD